MDSYERSECPVVYKNMRIQKRAKQKSVQRQRKHILPAERQRIARSQRTIRPKKEKNIFATIGEIASLIPPKDIQKIPKDLSINIDHYLYGVPKAEPWRPV